MTASLDCLSREPLFQIPPPTLLRGARTTPTRASQFSTCSSPCRCHARCHFHVAALVPVTFLTATVTATVTVPAIITIMPQSRHEASRAALLRSCATLLRRLDPILALRYQNLCPG